MEKRFEFIYLLKSLNDDAFARKPYFSFSFSRFRLITRITCFRLSRTIFFLFNFKIKHKKWYVLCSQPSDSFGGSFHISRDHLVTIRLFSFTFFCLHSSLLYLTRWHLKKSNLFLFIDSKLILNF